MSDLGVGDVGAAVDSTTNFDATETPDGGELLDVVTDVGDSSDTGADVPFHCAADTDCVGREGPVCDVSSGRCVSCLPSADNCPTGQYCVAVTNTCAAGCGNDADCTTPTGDGGTSAGHCDTTTHACVECTVDAQCPAGTLCVGNTCVTGCNDHRACPAGQTCCSGGCVDTQSNTAACGTCGTRCELTNGMPACLNGTCSVGACNVPFADCNNSVADGCEANTQVDSANCGACGVSCMARPHTTSRCTAGACAYECEAGFADCDGDSSNGCEIDTRTSSTHCGRCMNACALANATSVCTAGACTVSSCTTGFADCDGNALNGCETDTRTSVSHCGSCATACMGAANAVPACVTSVCALTCTAGFADCDGRVDNGCEADTRVSVNHCGGCGRSCTLPHATSTCNGSVCAVGACDTGFGDCDGDPSNGCETNLQNTAGHCGACGTMCSAANATSVCTAGTCSLSACSAGFGNCDGNPGNGCETNLQTTVGHCGACGTMCSAANAMAGCVGGMCSVAACNSGFGDCDHSAANGCETNTQTSDLNCGACGTVCAGGRGCIAGVCGALRSCREIHQRFSALPSGIYPIDPDGAGGAAGYDVYCDMTTDGGGWTLTGTIYNSSPTDTRRWNTDTVFTGASTFGALTARNTDDFKSEAYAGVVGTDMLVQTDEYYFGFRSLLVNRSMAAFITANVSAMCSTTWMRSGVDFASTNLTATQRNGVGFTVRGLDVNGGGPTTGCATGGTNETSFLSFAAGPSWWVFGGGNCANCAVSSYDNGMLNLATLSFTACTVGTWPCNAHGLYWSSSAYPSGPDTKTRYIQLFVR